MAILPRKIGTKATARKRSAFSPDMLAAFCAEMGETLGTLLDTRVAVTLDSFGMEPMGDALPGPDDTICAGIFDANAIERALMVLPDDAMLFHVSDIMLGADVMVDEPVVPPPPSTLKDGFCLAVCNAVMTALESTCDTAIGPSALRPGAKAAIGHDREAVLIVAPETDVLSVRCAIALGKGGRTGSLAIHLPLSTIDALSATTSGKAASPVFKDGPWFDHMKSAVAEVELEAVAVLHTEQMTLATVSRLAIGDVLKIEADEVNSVAVVLADKGDLVVSGELGIRAGKRAISVNTPPDAVFVGAARQLFA